MSELELLWPLRNTKAPITQPWGANPRVYKKFGQLSHNGIDIGCVEGTAVVASIDATVRFAGDGFREKLMGSAAGMSILLETDDLLIGFAHLSRIYVREGDSVSLNDVIGLSGATGAVTGPHLHWEALRKPLSLSNGHLGRFDITPHIVMLPSSSKTPLPAVEDTLLHAAQQAGQS